MNIQPHLLEQECTLDGYCPFEVLIWVLGSKCEFHDVQPDTLYNTRMLYNFLRYT